MLEVYPYSNYINQNYYNSAYGLDSAKPEDIAPVDADKKAVMPKKSGLKYKNLINEVPYNPSFSASNLRTQLLSNDEKNKYNALLQNLDKSGRKGLDNLLKGGILLNSDSTDSSTVLDNLYNILTTKRADGLDNNKLAADLIETLNNPYRIKQKILLQMIQIQN